MRSLSFWLLLSFLICGTVALADELLLKDGREFSGKLVRADPRTVEFRTQGKIETFNTSDVERIIFKEPELAVPGARMEPSVKPMEDPSTAHPRPAPPAEARVAPQPSTPPEVRHEDSVTLPAGSPVVIRTTEQIDTDQDRHGDTFEATLEDPLIQDGRTLAPRGSRVTGRIAWAEESGRVRGQSQLILELTALEVDGRSFEIRTTDYVEVGASQGKRTAAAASGGAVLGAIIGAIAGGGKGAAIGAAAGAGAGTTIQVLTKGQTLKVPAETVLQFRLQKPVTLPLP